uniref:NAD(P)/FAD-dependent oxidoreductase n=1 Tax=Mobilibacterium timonense TaxID=1871012 RepID=UPI003A915AA0
MAERFDVIIVGGGPAGLTAGIYAGRAGKTAAVFERETIGGQITFTDSIDNYPGTPGISGAEYAMINVSISEMPVTISAFSIGMLLKVRITS